MLTLGLKCRDHQKCIVDGVTETCHRVIVSSDTAVVVVINTLASHSHVAMSHVEHTRLSKFRVAYGADIFLTSMRRHVGPLRFLEMQLMK